MVVNINRAYLESLSRRELQTQAKEYNVRANQKSSIMVDQILFEVHKQKQKKTHDENDNTVANKLPESEEKELSTRLQKLSVTPCVPRSRSKNSVEEKPKPIPSTETLGNYAPTALSHTPIKHPFPVQKVNLSHSEKEKTSFSKKPESLKHTDGAHSLDEMKITLAVNALKALNCKRGATLEQLQNFIAMNPTPHLTTDDINSVLCSAVDKRAIFAVSAGDSRDDEVRFYYYLPALPQDGFETEAFKKQHTKTDSNPRRKSKIADFLDTHGSNKTSYLSTEKNHRVSEQNAKKHSSTVSRPPSTGRTIDTVNKTKIVSKNKNRNLSMLQRAMIQERRKRQATRVDFIDRWSTKVQSCSDKVNTMKLLNQCICNSCGCLNNHTFVSNTKSMSTETAQETIYQSSTSHSQRELTSAGPTNASQSYSRNKYKKSATFGSDNRRVSLQHLYRNGSEKRDSNQSEALSFRTARDSEGSSITLSDDLSQPTPPWQIMESRSKPGKFYFFNPITKESKWT